MSQSFAKPDARRSIWHEILLATALLATLLTTGYASALTLAGGDAGAPPAATAATSPTAAAPLVPASTVDPTARSRVVSGYGKLPIRFEPNVGQAPSPVKFLARDAGYSVALTEHGAILNLRRGGTTRSARPDAKLKTLSAPVEQATLSLSLVHAKAEPGMLAEQRQSSISNYFIGNDHSKWHSKVANYGAVRYEQVYPGIDWVVYGNPRQLEYDLVVAPKANPRRIKLRIEGADTLALDGNGDLLVKVKDQTLRQVKPVIYQTTAMGDRQPVAGHYVLDDQQIAFDLGDYDHSRSLVIDPALIYSTYLGGSGSGDEAYGIAVDSVGNAYVAGKTSSTDFPTANPVWGAEGGTDAFVTELNANGSSLIYSTYLGGSGDDEAYAIAVDSSGAAYVTGFTSSSNFPTSCCSFQTSVKGVGNPFVTKLSADGSSLVYSTYLGINIEGEGGNNYGAGIAVDRFGSAYVTGLAGNNTASDASPNFPTTPGAFQTNLNGFQNAFVTKLNIDGSALFYSTLLGGGKSDHGNGIAVDGSGAAYVTGCASSNEFPSFPTTPGAFQTSVKGPGNAFVTKLNANGSALIYSTLVGGSGGDGCDSDGSDMGDVGDSGRSIAVDSSGAVYVTGQALSRDFPVTLGAFQTSLNGDANAFITKLNANGSALIYSTLLGGGFGSGKGNSIAVDNSGSAHVTGWTEGGDFPTTPGAFQTSDNGVFQAFVSQLSADGGSLVYSTYLGGSGNGNGAGDHGNSIALDSSGAVYVSGQAGSSDFPITVGAFQTSLKSTGVNYQGNAFISKLIPISVAQISVAPTALSFGTLTLGSTSAAQAVTLTNSSDIALTIASIDTGSALFGSSTFSQTNACGSSLAAGAHCAINVTFSPTVAGTANDTLTIVTAVTSLTVALSGNGTAAPATPVGLTARAGNDQVKLSWTASAGATSYNIYEGTTSGGEAATPVRTGISNSAFTVTGLTNETQYYFKVKAVNANGESAKSNQVTATPELVPAAPTGLSAKAGNGQVKLSWTASAEATSYNIYEGTTSGGEATVPVHKGVINGAFTITGLSNGTHYYFKVTAVNVDAESAESSQTSATPEVVPAAPTGLTAKAGNGQVILNWTTSSGATSYNIYDGTTSKGEAATPVHKGVAGGVYTVTGLSNGTKYFFEVTAVDVDAESVKSSQVSATPE